MLVNRFRDTDVVSVSGREEPEEAWESAENRKKKNREAVHGNPDTAGAWENPNTVHEVWERPDTAESLNKKILTANQTGREKTMSRTGRKKRTADEILCVNAKISGTLKDGVDDLTAVSDAEFAGNKSRSDGEADYAGMHVVRTSAKKVTGFIVKEALNILKMIAAATGKLLLVPIAAAVLVIAIAASILPSLSGEGNNPVEDADAAIYVYHSYNQHNYTGQANKACGVTAVASALASLGLDITPDMLEAHNNNHVGLFYGADAWVNNHYPVKISRTEVSADTIDQALTHGSLCVVYLHNNCEVSAANSQWNTGKNVSGGGCHWITLIGYTEAGLIAALDPADGTGNEEYCLAENCEGGITDKAISMDEVMESCSNIYIITPTGAREENETLLAALIYSEAGASYEDKLAVGTVVMNRLKMHLYGALTLEDVIYEPNQFEGTKTANFKNALANGAPAQCRQVAYEILYEGKRSDLIPSDCVSFMALSISESEMRRRTGCTQFVIIDQRFGW